MSAAGEVLETDIVAIGGRGDGVAETPGGRVFVPFTLPGDRVRLRLDGRSPAEVARIADGPGRIAPACRHFETCGGCALQHVCDDDCARWKRGLVELALARRGLETEVGATIRVPPGARRRARFGARATARGMLLGFKERRSHRLVDVVECPVLAPAIVAAAPALRDALSDCLQPGETAEVSVTSAEGGLDVLVESRRTPDLAARRRLAALADAADLARLSWGGDPVVERRAVRTTVAGVAVELPPGAFLQPTAAGEAALSERVAAGLAGSGAVADLFAGCGAFTLVLAAAAKSVRSVEADPAQAAAVAAAARRAGWGARVTVEARDLNRRPLAGGDLAGLDGVVLDPPRPGAAPQARAIAHSPVPVVIYVSCNPATFARDARTLVDGGYRLDRVTPLDQFLWSPHVELVASLRRA